jgi:hypothetical protein
MRGPVEAGRDIDNAEVAGTELELRNGGRASREKVAHGGTITPVAGAGGGRAPPERNDGHSERSSGNEVPPLLDGDI